MQKKRSIKIISVVLILVLLCVSITYVKSGNKEVLATTKEFNSENLQDNEHMHVEIDSSGDKVPVPNGYVGSKARGENEIDTGYVIYEGEEEVNDENVEEAQKTRNQYVWIPVPDASTMYGTDKNGKKWGKLYNFATYSSNSNYNELTGAYPNNWIENNGIISIQNMDVQREPDIVPIDRTTGYDIDYNLKTVEGNLKSTNELLMQLEQEFNSMIESVKKYGGFYIGRYETGDLSGSLAVIKKGNTDINNQTWYKMYDLCKKLKMKNTNIETGMIWGCQRDRTLIWLVESGNKNKSELTNSINWGNYSNSTFEFKTIDGTNSIKNINTFTMIPTGNAEYTKANNIYDLAGNVSEQSMESSGTYRRVYRSGNYMNNGYSYAVSNRYGTTPSAKGGHFGCRAMLYIK